MKEAQKEGVKFGLWIEPEMVNSKSELYEKQRAIVFNYLTSTRQKITATPRPVRLLGLDPQKRYRIQKINL